MFCHLVYVFSFVFLGKNKFYAERFLFLFEKNAFKDRGDLGWIDASYLEPNRGLTSRLE